MKLSSDHRRIIAKHYKLDRTVSVGWLARFYGRLWSVPTLSPTAIQNILAEYGVPIRGREEQLAIVQGREPRTSRRPRQPR